MDCWPLFLPARVPDSPALRRHLMDVAGTAGAGLRLSRPCGLSEINHRIARKGLRHYLPVRNVSKVRMTFNAEMQRSKWVLLDALQDIFVPLAAENFEHCTVRTDQRQQNRPVFKRESLVPFNFVQAGILSELQLHRQSEGNKIAR